MRKNDTNPLLMLIAAGTAAGALLSAAPAFATPPVNPEDLPLAHNEQGDLASIGGNGGFGGPAFPNPRVGEGFAFSLLAAGLGPSHAIGGPGINGFDTQIYVVLSDSNSVVKVDDSGAVTPFADLSDVVPEGRLVLPAFDVVGNYGGMLHVNNDPNKIYELDADGTPGGTTVIEDETWRNDALACDPYGAFGGRLFLSEAHAVGSLYTIGTDGSIELFASGTGDVGRGITFAPGAGSGFGDAMYIANAERRRVFRVAPDHQPGEPAPIWADLSGRGIQPVSLAISAGGAFGADVMYVADAEGRIVRLGPDGSYLGEFATNLGGAATIEFPRTGLFAGSMVVTVNGDIWILRASCAADWDGDRSLNSNDLFAFLTGYFAGEADFDADGTTNSNDFFAFLDAFFGGCP